MGATVPAAVPTEGETAPVPVAAEPAPVSASVPSAPANAPAEAPPPLPESDPAPTSAVVPAVQKQVAEVVQGASGGGLTRRVRSAAGEAASAATHSLESATDSVNAQPALAEVSGSVRPVVEKVVGAVHPAIDKVENGVSAIERRSGDVSPGLVPTAPSFDRSHTGTADRTSDTGQPPLSEPAPQIRKDSALPTFENAIPLETRPVARWIDGLNLRELFAPAPAGRQAPDRLPGAAPIDPTGVVSGGHASPYEAPSRPPLDPPGPISGLSTSASPGPGGGSFFVPIAALLALLALAAPATSRRRKEALAAPVPSRFVCALERPG